MDTDVLIVGAGPTGLMLANQLGRWGVRVVIVDRHSAPAQETRALGVQARTLEIYSHLGIVDKAVAFGTKGDGAAMWVGGRRVARVPFGDIGRHLSPYPYLLILGQDDNEQLLGECLRSRGIPIQWNTELVGLAQEPKRVVAKLKQPDGTVREITAAWVGGCDGARSSVRELTGIAFLGAAYEEVFFVTDTRMTGPMEPGVLNVYLWPRGFHLFFPMRGTDHWRLVGILPPALRSRNDVTFDDVIPSLREEAGSAVSFQECTWFSTYRIHHRRAERFRNGRCFILGDAAHTHSPVGAQGMNTGLQDAYNLAWKLALVVSGWARTTLLDTYEAERIPIAQRLLRTTDQLFSLIVSRSKLGAIVRTRLLPTMLAFAMKQDWVRKLAFRTISQTGIKYPDSPLSEARPGLPKHAPTAGDRFPWLHFKFSPTAPNEDLYQRLDDTRFTLLLFGQPAPRGGVPELGDLLRVLAIPDDPANEQERARAGIPRPAFYLLRPDGHVGLCGTNFDLAAAGAYLTTRLNAVPRA